MQLGVTEWRRDLTGGNHKKRCRKIDQEDAKTRSQKAGAPEDGAAWPNSPQAQESRELGNLKGTVSPQAEVRAAPDSDGIQEGRGD